MAISRRAWLKRLGAAGTAAVVSESAGSATRGSEPVDTAGTASRVPAYDENQAGGAALAKAPAREAYETLTAAESDILEAVTARIIPSDQNGPGAKEARAAHYIDRALAGPLAAARPAYAAGLAALDAYAQQAKGAPFAKLPPGEQDAVLTDLEKNVATGFTPSASAFFAQMRSHTIEGTFTDPYYGGNAGFVGWDLIGYPGVRVSVSQAEQQMNATVTPNHRSAYDFAMFAKNAGTQGHIDGH